MPRLYALDFLRGGLAIAVMFYHILHYENVMSLYAVGRYGVYCFFIISGASLYYVYSKSFESNKLKSYFVKRYFRIAPLLYLAILIALPLKFLSGTEILTYEYIYKIILNIPLVYGFQNPGGNSIAPASWSIGIECAFYVFFPLLLVVCKDSIKKLLLITVVSYFIHRLYMLTLINPDVKFSAQWNIYTHPLNFLYYFTAGMLFAELYFRKHERIKHTKSFILIAVLCVSIFFVIPYENSMDIVSGWQAPLMAGVSLVLVLSSVFIEVKSNVIKSLSLFLGNISYSVYLLHYPIYSVLKRLDVGLYNIVLTPLLTLYIAHIVYTYWEEPWRRMGRTVGK